MQIQSLEQVGAERWDNFVQSTDAASFFHLSGWQRVLRESFGHKSWFLAAVEGDELRGVLPLCQLKSRLFGNQLVSLPFGVYGGAVAESEPARELLETAAIEQARQLKVDALELRQREPVHPDWPTKRLYYTFVKEISADNDENLKAIPRKQRAMVRKGIKAGLKGEISDDLDAFYHVYSTSVRNLGTPVFPKRYFAKLREYFADATEILLVREPAGQVIAAVMSFYFKDAVLPYYGGSLPQARQLKGNDFMYWDLMSRAAERGVRLFDYGRSKEGTGAFSFKKNWGFEPQPLYYEYKLIKARQMPEINPNNPRYRLFIDWWKRLPLPVANTVGPWLSPYLG